MSSKKLVPKGKPRINLSSIFLAIFTLTLLSESKMTTFPSNTQVTSFQDLLDIANRVNESPDLSSFSCRYRKPGGSQILVALKSHPQPIEIPVDPTKVLFYQIALVHKNIAIASYRDKILDKIFFSLTTSSLVRSYTPNPVFAGPVLLLKEIRLDIPHIFASSGHSMHYLIDYTKDSGEMVVARVQLAESTSDGVSPYSAVYREKPSPKIMTANNGKYLIRLGYSAPGGVPLVIEDSYLMTFIVKKMRRVENTDYLFFRNTETSMAYLINAMGPLDGNHVLKEVRLPWYFDYNSQDITDVNQVFGNYNEHLLQIWTTEGRLVLFTFPETGEEPQFHGEVWHKKWKLRYPKVKDVEIRTVYFPTSGDFFTCSGCGSTGAGPCIFSWQFSPICSACRGPGDSDCTSCPARFLLEAGSCVKACSPNQYRKSKSECVDCPADHTYIKSNLTCLNCWDHNDYSQCGFTRLAYNISLQESFLNISFVYSINFYGEERSLKKLTDESINWPRIFEVASLKDSRRDPECQRPRYVYDEVEKQLRITLGQCHRESRFTLRTLRSKVIMEQFEVKLMLNTTGRLNKILVADDDIPDSARYLFWVTWIPIVLFFGSYLILRQLPLGSHLMKQIGNFLKILDFIQCLALLEVEYRVLTSKFFWLIEYIFSSPEFEIFGDRLNERYSIGRQRYLGKVYEEYEDKMAFNNFDLVIIAYLLAAVSDLILKLLPWKIECLKSVVSDIRKFMYDYAFFEFFINIMIDLSNIKQIFRKGNTLSKTCLIFELFILLTAIWGVIVQLVDEEDEKNMVEIMIGKKDPKQSEGVSLTIQDSERVDLREQDSNRSSLNLQKEKIKSPNSKRKKLKKNRTNVNPHKDQTAKEQVKRSKSTPNPNTEQIKSSEKKSKGIPLKNNKKYPGFNWLLKNSEAISDLRFIVIQVLIATVRGSNSFQFGLIMAIQILLVVLALLKLVFRHPNEVFIINFSQVFQEISIGAFILVLVITGTHSDILEMIIVFSLSICLIIEFLIIVIEIVLSFASLLVEFIRKQYKKGRVQPRSGKLLTSYPNNVSDKGLGAKNNANLKREKTSNSEDKNLENLRKEDEKDYQILDWGDRAEEQERQKNSKNRRVRSRLEKAAKKRSQGKKMSYIRKTPLEFKFKSGRPIKVKNKNKVNSKKPKKKRVEEPETKEDVWMLAQK